MTKRKPRRLTEAQQKLAEDALRHVPVAVRAFVASHPSYRSFITKCDLVSVANMAVVEASFTYDPTKSKPQTYYGSAVRHALLKEARRYQRSREGAAERVSLDRALSMRPGSPGREVALRCLACLPAEERALVESAVIEGRSFMSLGRDHDRDWRTIKSKLRRTLRALVACVASDGVLSGSPATEQ